MLQPGDLITDAGVNADFFFQFAAEGVAGLFALFDFAARKFPFQRQRLMLRSLADEHFSVAKNQGCYDLSHKK